MGPTVTVGAAGLLPYAARDEVPDVDGWFCSDCRSHNTPRAKRCYHCNLPRAYGETSPEDQPVAIVRSFARGEPPARPAGDTSEAPVGPEASTPGGSDVPGAGITIEGALRTKRPGRPVRARPTIAQARSSRVRSRVVIALLAATIGWSALTTTILLARGGTMGLLLDLVSGDMAVVGLMLLFGGVGVLLTFATAMAWFVWFDRVLRNVPPLTGTWPDTGRAAAIGWWLVPIVGFIKAPRIVGDVYHRLSVPRTPGLWLIALWVLTWIGGTVGPTLATRVMGFVPMSLHDRMGMSDLIELLGSVSYVAAGFFAVAVVSAIEHASHTRAVGGGVAMPAAASATAPPHPGPGLTAVAPVARVARASIALRAPWELPATPQPAAGVSAGGTDASRTAPGASEPVSRRALVGTAGVVAAAFVGGLVFAGTPPPRPYRDPMTAIAASLRTPPPPTPIRVDPVRLTTVPLLRTPGPTPTAPPPEVTVAARLVEITFSETYSGRMDMDATLRSGDGPALEWSVSTARNGRNEWVRSQVEVPRTGYLEIDEAVMLDKTTWTRQSRTRSLEGDWARRPRRFGDQPTAPLFDLRDPDQLEFQRSFREDGRTLYQYRWEGANTSLANLLKRAMGGATLERSVATVVADADGLPVRSELDYTFHATGGTGGTARVQLRFRYRDVGRDVTISSPRAGSPVAD
jgi:hypothetical protein